VGVVTKPFLFEGTRRMRAAEAGIDELQKHVDTLIVIPNQNLFLVAKAETTFKEAFQLADEVLQQGVRSITDLMVMPGLINLDFADVRSVMAEMGKAMMGTGEGEGPHRALEAAEKAIANPRTTFATWLIPMPTSSGVRPSIPTSTARSASRSSPPGSSRLRSWPRKPRGRSAWAPPVVPRVLR
jgi:hypothetical protein